MNPSASRARRAHNPNTPDRFEINEVASDLVVKYGGMMLKDAIEFSANPSDAEDAYQRSVEILLTKAPTTDPNELVPWLRTVVRREARDISRRNYKADVPLADADPDTFPDSGPSPESRAESYAALEIGAEAIGKLTPDQIKCVLAQNEGLEYEEIAEATGFSRRKVSRCLERARVAFAHNVEAIAAGSECERIEPLLHRLIEGDSDAAISARPHLRHCLACRARLREYENAPRRIAVLIPPVLVLAGRPSTSAMSKIADWWSSIGDRISIHMFGADRWVEASGVKKVGVVAALASATIGGGAAVHEIEQRPHSTPVPAVAADSPGARPTGPAQLFDEVTVTKPRHRSLHRRRQKSVPVGTDQPAAPVQTAPEPQAPVDDGSAEFLPEARGTE